MNQTWAELTKSALLGTERMPPSPAAPGLLGTMLEALADRGAEERLLGSAALVWQHERAGAQAAALDSDYAIPEAPAERLEPASPRACAILAEALLAKEQSVVLYWLRCAEAARRRVPYQSLPALLNLSRGSIDLRRQLLPVLGERGGWLAERNSEWKALKGGELQDASAWETGSNEARLKFLQELRARDPAQAREQLQKVWKQEKAKQRSEFLAVLELGLSAEDEPFLEACLDDRSEEVRSRALHLLNAIPTSAFMHRMNERAKGLMSLGESGSVRKLQFVPAVPVDAALLRDGLPPPAKNVPAEDPAYRRSTVSYILSRVAPSTFAAQLGVTLSEFIALARDASAERFAWMVEASFRTKSMDFIRAWFLSLNSKDFDVEFIQRAPSLDPATRESILRDYLRGDWGRVHSMSNYLDLVPELPSDLQATFYPAVLERSARKWSQAKLPEWREDYLLTRLASSMPASLYPESLEILAGVEMADVFRDLIPKLMYPLQQRFEIQREFAP